jgi:hypothetical protein
MSFLVGQMFEMLSAQFAENIQGVFRATMVFSPEKLCVTKRKEIWEMEGWKLILSNTLSE